MARPSELAPGIPDALDALVLDLLQLVPDVRPTYAAEVMERLAAIEGRALDEQLVVAQSYLTRPTFVGHTAELARIRTKTLRAMRKRGSAALVEGGSGVVRTRFLDACVLASKLLGMTVLRAVPTTRSPANTVRCAINGRKLESPGGRTRGCIGGPALRRLILVRRPQP